MALSQNDDSCGIIGFLFVFFLPLQNLFMGSEKGEFLLLLLFWWRILPLPLK